MERVMIHYFSGTGNTLLAAKCLSQELEKYGYDPSFHAMENGLYDISVSYSLHIFFFPVYATSVPHIVLKYIRNLPDGKNINAAVISTNGKISTKIRDGYQGWALHQARLYLGIKKYNVLYSNTLDFPHNITVALPPRKYQYNEEIISKATVNIPHMAEQLAKREVYHRKFFIPNIIWSLPFGIAYSLVGRRIIGKLFTADDTCTSCGLCIKRCPAKAIVNKQNCVSWKWNCEGCLRCINNCPKKAIQTSGIRILAVIFAMSVNIFRFFIPDAFIQSLGNTEASFFELFTEVISFILIVDIFELLYGKASYFRLFKKVSGWGFSRLYDRYRATDFEAKFLKK